MSCKQPARKLIAKPAAAYSKLNEVFTPFWRVRQISDNSEELTPTVTSSEDEARLRRKARQNTSHRIKGTARGHMLP